MSLRDSIYRFYWKLESAIVPGLVSSQYRYYEALKQAIGVRGNWLDIGCGHQVFGQWMKREQEEMFGLASFATGMDPVEEDVRAHSGFQNKVSGSADELPFRGGSFDVVSANMVVEHLQKPAEALRQVHRVLKPGGRFVFHTTNFNSPLIFTAYYFPQGPKNLIIKILENREAADVFPTVYMMNREEDVRRLARECGFSVKSIELVSTSAVTAVLGPVAAFELLCTRLCRAKALAGLRSNLVVTLQKI